MNKNYLASILLLSALTFFPTVVNSSPSGTVGSLKVSIDNVVISNQELSGKIDFLPVISSKDVHLDFGLGACWDGGNFEINVNNTINNTTSVISGTAPHLSNCSNWYSSPAGPASYTLMHDRTFNGQSVNFEYPGNPWPNTQNLKIIVYEDLKRDKSTSDLNNKFKGYIMLNTEDAGKAYYISPISKKAYYLAIPKISFQVMRGTGVGITNNNLSKIPVGGSCPNYMLNCDNSGNYDMDFTNQNKGYIFLQVEENGEAWYVYPKDGKRYFLGTPENAFEIMKGKGWGINNNDFEKLELAYGSTNSTNILQEVSFGDIKYRAYRDKVTEVKNNDEITLFEINKTLNEQANEEITFIDNPRLELSPSGYILFFSYWEGLNNCKKNGIQLDSNELLWEDHISCSAQIFWSPDNKQVGFTWNTFDVLNISVSKFGDIKTLEKILEIGYPYEEQNTKFYWKSNNIFIFEPNPEYADWLDDSPVDLGINEFKVR